jgi:GNAT superfamily N-acetyltransferase
MIHIRHMTAADLPFAMRLKEQAGWNQVEADWRRFLDMQPDGSFVAELAGTPVGTTVACIFGDVAWVAMVLVEATVRGRGVGTALMRHALDFLDEHQVPSIRLDATPLGQPIYEKLGFRPEYTLSRYDGVLAASSTDGAAAANMQHVTTAARADDDLLLALDRSVTGADRRKFLVRLFRERPQDVRLIAGPDENDRVAGVLAARGGGTAVQLGPGLGDGDAAAVLLADAAVRHTGKRIYLDVPQPNEPAIRLAESLGLTVQRALVRMCRGNPVREDTQRLFASSGPELG